MNTQKNRRLITGIALLGAASLALSGCVQSQRNPQGDPSSSAGEGSVDSTFVFAASSDPSGLDPAFASDGETFRVSRQIFEGLVGVAPGTPDPAPLLATEWTQNDEGTEFVFTLQEGVTFHDGTEFNAEAVCANFDRWYNWEGLTATESLSYYYGKLFQGFAGDDTALYKSCAANEDGTATVSLTRPFAGFIASLSLPAFAMQSPTALEEFGADQVGGSEEAPEFSEYAKGNPVGTGPFMFTSWSPGENVVLNAFPDYWGDQGQVQEIEFRIIDDPTARKQALESGDVDGYDLVAPADTGALKDAGYNVMQRDPFTILYLAFNQAVPELQDQRVREAITLAVDREALVTQVLPEGTKVASQFMPDSVNGYNEEVTKYEYDPDRAKQLLADAGFADGLTLDFNYPVNVSRPYMPNPEQVFTAITAQLEEVGITVNPVAEEWGEYLDRMRGSKEHGIHLLGWTGDYNDTDNFLGVFFGTAGYEWGFENEELFTALAEARSKPDAAEAAELYKAINEQVAQFMPGVPLAHPAPSLAFDKRVKSYPASPVNDEVYNLIELSK